MAKWYDIFISYRRDGAEYLAQVIRDRLVAKGYSVFYDIDAMRSGDFNKQLLDVIDNCKAVILVLPRNGLKRCVNDDDWVRLEIARALKGDKKIIPVMMRGFKFPDELPADISAVKNMQGVPASQEYFDAVIEKICGYLNSVCKPSQVIPEIPETEGRFRKVSMLEARRDIEAREPLDDRLSDDVTGFDFCAIAAAGLVNSARDFLQRKLEDPDFSVRAVINDPESAAAREACEYKLTGTAKQNKRRIENSRDILTDWSEEYPGRFNYKTTELFLPAAIFIVRKKDINKNTIKVDYYDFGCTDSDRRSIYIKYSDTENYAFYEKQFEWIWSNSGKLSEHKH